MRLCDLATPARLRSPKWRAFINSSENKKNLARVRPPRETIEHLRLIAVVGNDWKKKRWFLRSPDNAVFVFENLNQFIRDNRERFPNPNFNTVRASLAALRPTRRSRTKGSAYGWTWATTYAIADEASHDLLARK